MEQIHPKYDREFVNKWWDMTRDFLERTLKGEEKVTNLKMPDELQKLIALEVGDEPCTKEHLIEETKKVLHYQTKPYHPHFHNQVFGGFDQSSFLGAVSIPAINGSVYTYEMAPVFTLMENATWEYMRKCVGWEEIDGTMTPGGSIANFYSIHMAKNHAFPDINKKGLFGFPTMKMFSSDVSHYSLKKGANITGVGIDNVVPVPTDAESRMIPAELEKAIQAEIEKGNKPFMVNITLGTTVEGAIDPIVECSAIAHKYGCWAHVDGAFGGAFLMSPKLRERLGTFENVDSITFDPHKALVAPQQAAFFLCRHKSMAQKVNSLKADYLFHKERASYSGDLDVGDKQLMCGRVIDIFKLWTYFKLNGWTGVAGHVEQEHHLARYAKEYCLKNPERFKMVFDGVDTFTTCFYYLPKNLDKASFASEDEYWEVVAKIHVLAKKFMIEEGKVMIGYSKTKGKPYFWRLVASNPFLEDKHVEYEIEHLAKYCEMA